MNYISEWRRSRPDKDTDRMDAEIKIGDRSHALYLSSNDLSLTNAPEALIAVSLLPAMREGGSITMDGDNLLDGQLLDNLSTIQDIYRSWAPTLHHVKYPCSQSPSAPHPEKRRTASFFSGGVDSQYTLLKHFDEITDLIFVHGFDIKLQDQALRNNVSQRLRALAEAYGKNLIEIETNLRDLLNPYAKWGMLSHGAALATVGLMLSESFDRIFIPATHTYAELFPWGSHPVLDPLWSISGLEFVHDGCEAERIDKVERIATNETALQNLRVCWQNPGGAYNCGTCEKCIRTLINLAANNALDRCNSFESALTPSRIRKIRAYDANTRSFIEENLNALNSRRFYPEFQHALRYVLAQPVWPYHAKRKMKAYWRDIHGVKRSRSSA